MLHLVPSWDACVLCECASHVTLQYRYVQAMLMCMPPGQVFYLTVVYSSGKPTMSKDTALMRQYPPYALSHCFLPVV